MAEDVTPAYLPPSDYPKLRLMAEAACYEADNEIVAALAEIDRLRAALRESCEENRSVALAEPTRTHMCPLAELWDAATSAPSTEVQP